MPKIIFGVALVIFLGLAACVGLRAPQIRGVADSYAHGAVGRGMLVSNSLPAMAVLPAEGFRPVAHGVEDVVASLGGSALGGQSARVWYALHVGPDGKGQLVADIAALNNVGWEWSLNPMFTERRGLKMLREEEIPRYGVQFTALTYIRPVARDPWMPAFAMAGGWEGPVLVRQYTWWALARQVKVVVEYREPVPEEHIEDHPAALRAFEDRADAAFRLLRREEGDTLPESIEKAVSRVPGVSARLLGEVLGEVQPSLRSRDDSI